MSPVAWKNKNCDEKIYKNRFQFKQKKKNKNGVHTTYKKAKLQMKRGQKDEKKSLLFFVEIEKKKFFFIIEVNEKKRYSQTHNHNQYQTKNSIFLFICCSGKNRWQSESNKSSHLMTIKPFKRRIKIILFNVLFYFMNVSYLDGPKVLFTLHRTLESWMSIINNINQCSAGEINAFCHKTKFIFDFFVVHLIWMISVWLKLFGNWIRTSWNAASIVIQAQ